MGMTYEELSMYGRLRKIFMCGPVSMFKVYVYGLLLCLSSFNEVFEMCSLMFRLFLISIYVITGKASSHQGK